LIETEAFILDIPVSRMPEGLRKGNQEAFFSVHFAEREKEYSHSEKLLNLISLPNPFGFKLAKFPIKDRKSQWRMDPSCGYRKKGNSG
jgi:cyclase